MGDKVKIGDPMFLIDYDNLLRLKKLALNELETRKRKVEILSSLVNKGSDSEFRLLDEKLQLIESQKDMISLKDNLNFLQLRQLLQEQLVRLTLLI